MNDDMEGNKALPKRTTLTESVKMKNYDMLAHCLAQAVAQLFQNDAYLLETKAHEIAINHRIAIYLEKYFQLRDSETKRKVLSVDLEYNRVISSNLLAEKGKHTALTYEYINHNDEILHMKKDARPDIVVHKRGSGHHNTLWLEIKLGSDSELCREDREKAFYACTQLGFEIGVAMLINYPNKFLTMYMITQNRGSIIYEFNVSNTEAEIVFKQEKFEDRPEPRELPLLLRKQ